MPEVSIGAPLKQDKYTLINIDSIEVYVDKFIDFKEDFTIKLNKVLGFKYLIIDGWKTI